MIFRPDIFAEQLFRTFLLTINIDFCGFFCGFFGESKCLFLLDKVNVLRAVLYKI